MREKQEEIKVDFDEMLNVKDSGLLPENGRKISYDIVLDADNDLMRSVKV